MEWSLEFTQPDGSQLSFDLQGVRTTYTVRNRTGRGAHGAAAS
jgi:hypothetical protein